jgi:hypothetical protein
MRYLSAYATRSAWLTSATPFPALSSSTRSSAARWVCLIGSGSELRARRVVSALLRSLHHVRCVAHLRRCFVIVSPALSTAPSSAGLFLVRDRHKVGALVLPRPYHLTTSSCTSRSVAHCRARSGCCRARGAWTDNIQRRCVCGLRPGPHRSSRRLVLPVLTATLHLHASPALIPSLASPRCLRIT